MRINYQNLIEYLGTSNFYVKRLFNIKPLL